MMLTARAAISVSTAQCSARLDRILHGSEARARDKTQSSSLDGTVVFVGVGVPFSLSIDRLIKTIFCAATELAETHL
jgi:hypothetical protein